MTHPSIHARTQPDKIAYQMAGTGKAITYRELDAAVEPGRAAVSRARPEGGRPHRVPDREPAGVHGDLLGGAARGPVLHRDQPLPRPRTRSPTSSRTAAPSSSSPRRNAPSRSRGWSPARPASRCSTCSTSRSPASAHGTRKRPRSRPRRSPTKSPATTCCIRPAPPDGRRASSASPSITRSTCRTRS